MLKETQFKRFIYLNSYLLVIAAWLVTLSFITDNYWSVNASVGGAQKKISAHLHKQEKDFGALVKDTAVVNRLAKKQLQRRPTQALSLQKLFLFYLPSF